MKTILITLLGAAIISTLGLSAGLFMHRSSIDLQADTLSPYITFIEDSQIDNLQIQLQGKSDHDQLNMIQSFMLSQRKFFSANSIMKVLMMLKQKDYPDLDQVRNYAIQVMKPYIAPLSTNEAIQIIKLIDPYDGIASSIIVSQIYDLKGNIANQNLLISNMNGYGGFNRDQIINPQSTKDFRNNFLITSQGRKVGFIIDQSQSMSTISYTKPDGSNVTRYDLLRNFYDNRFDIFQSFSAFSLTFMGNYIDYTCTSCSTGSYEQAKAMNDFTRNVLKCGGENNLFSKLEQLLSQNYDQLSDLYIWTDGMITQGTKDVNDFIKLINETNSQRDIKVRINTISFLVGGNEPQAQKDEAIILLQTLSDYTKGTFIQINPQ